MTSPLQSTTEQRSLEQWLPVHGPPLLLLSPNEPGPSSPLLPPPLPLPPPPSLPPYCTGCDEPQPAAVTQPSATSAPAPAHLEIIETRPNSRLKSRAATGGRWAGLRLFRMR